MAMYHYTVKNKSTGETVLSSKGRDGWPGENQAWAAATNAMTDNQIDKSQHTIAVENTYKGSTGPTPEQLKKIEELRVEGYSWDKKHSIAAAGVVMKKADGDFWLFGMDGKIMHNPGGITVPVPKTNEKKWVRHRFHTDSKYWRPVKYNPSYPSWKTGESYEGDKSVVVAYLPATESLEDYWPEACCVTSDPCDGPVFTDRFPKPKDYISIEL